MAKISTSERLKILTDLVAFQSVNDHELEVCQYLQKLLQRYEISSEIVKVTETRANLVAEIGSGKPVLAVSGHMDVVSAGDPSLWASDPFKLTKRGNNLYGRGSADMKSGLASLVIALIEIKTQNLLRQGTIRLLATTGEEVGGAGAQLLAEKGYMEDADALVIAEPSQDTIIFAHKGSMDARVTSIGKAAHSSMPSLGFNAIDPLVDLIQQANQIFRQDQRSNDLLGDLVMNTTIINGGNQVNSIPEKAVAEMNIRTIPEFDNGEVLEKFQTLVDQQNQQGAKLTLDMYMSLPSVYTTGENTLVQQTAAIGKKHLGWDIPKLASPGVTDASNLLKGKGPDFPFVMFGPGETKMAHQVDEYVNQDVYLKFPDLYVELFTDYLK